MFLQMADFNALELPAGSTEKQARPAATKRRPKTGRAAPKGGGKAAGRGKLGEAAAAEPDPEAAQALGPELATLKAAIQRLRGEEVADRFTPETLKLLWDEFYRSEADLRTANKQTLRHIPVARRPRGRSHW